MGCWLDQTIKYTVPMPFKAFADREQDWTDIKGIIIRQKCDFMGFHGSMCANSLSFYA